MAYEEKEEGSGDEGIIKETRERLVQLIDNDESEREKMKDDLRFCTLDQWPQEIRKDREGDVENGPRPCLTIDKINQYIVQVVNDMRQGKPGINVRPQDDKADVETAKILKGIVRNIEDQSSADIAYATAGENAAKIGLGYFRIVAEYVDEEGDEQELRIRPIPNTFSVYLGPHILPDGSDAECGYIIEAMPLEEFKEEFPDAKCSGADFEGIDSDMMGHFITEETITVIECYEFEKTRHTLHSLADGTTILDSDYAAWPEAAGVRPTITKSRTTTKKQLKWRKMTAIEILDSRDLPGKWIPIVEVVGRETWVDGKRIVWGLVRPAKDSLRMYNYWASTITEKMGLAPKTPYVGAKGQFENLEDRWKSANKKNYAYLEYNAIDVNGNAIPAPQRQAPTPMEAAYFHFMQVIEHDVQTSLGMFKAATGESESQQSGRAILALQRESDTGTYHFGANQGISIRHGGRIIVDLIPHYYDTKRIVRIIGDDGEIQTAHIDPSQEMPMRQVQDQQGGAVRNIYNPTIGRYDVSITVGPSYNTKRMEAAATFVEMAKGAADPASASILRYLVMRNSDSSGSDEAAKLLKTMLPPQALQALASPQPIPPQVQAMMQQMQAKMQAMQEEGQKLQQENQQLKSGAQTKMMEVQANAASDAQKLKADQALAAQKQQMDAQKLAEERDREIVRIANERDLAEKKMRDAKELAIFEARLKAATAVDVAQINAKGSLLESAIQAEQAANTTLVESLQSDGNMDVPELPTTTPIMELSKQHKEGMDAHANGLDKLGSILGELTKVTAQLAAQAAKPKTIQAKSSSGNTITATVQ